jgi:LIM homeobox protein 2/9
MLFHGISGDHIQGIMEEMERRSKTDSRLAKGVRLNGREAVRKINTVQCCCCFS